VFVKNLDDCIEFLTNNGCKIRELLHPANDHLALPYSIAIAKIEKNKRSYLHKLEQHEVYFILIDEGEMHIGNEIRNVSRGDVVYIPATSNQWINNIGTCGLSFVAIVSPPWTKDGDMRLQDD